jgi:hypothetical protein
MTYGALHIPLDLVNYDVLIKKEAKRISPWTSLRLSKLQKYFLFL